MTSKMRSELVIYWLLLIIIGAWGCKGDQPVEGFDLLLDPGLAGQIDSLQAPLVLEKVFQDTALNTGRGTLLSLGSIGNLASRVLLKFGAVPDSLEYSRATLVLSTNAIIANGMSKSKFTAVVRKVSEPWDENTVSIDNFSFVPGEVLGTGAVKSVASAVTDNDSSFIENVRFELNEMGLALIQAWTTEAATDTHGIAVDFESSDFIKEFFSRGSSQQRPIIELEVSEGGLPVDTISTAATADAFVVEELSQIPSGPILVDNVFNLQAELRFQLNSIPREASVNRASLHLNVDQANTFVKSGGYSLKFEMIQSRDGDRPLPDSSGFGAGNTFVLNTSDEITIDVRTAVQLWLSHKDFENQGFLLSATTPGLDVGRVAFYSSQQINGLAPRLEIEYSTAPNTQ